MIILEIDKIQEAQSLPQMERFLDDKIYIVETLGDYDMLPANIKLWREMVANSG